MTNKDAIYKLKVNLTDTCIADCRCKEGEYSACDFCDDREAVKIAIKALEKQIPKKPKKDSDGIYCLCGHTVKIEYEGIILVYGFCPYCGQAIDWSE